jgi:hypothetical protein
MMEYGIAVGDAISASQKGLVSTETLGALRDQVSTIVGAQGDLIAALKELDAEISRRGGKLGNPEPEGDRFVAQITGLVIPDALRADVCQALQKAVMAEIAKLDKGGDMIATPLSQLRSFGSGFGSKTGGIAIMARAR